MGAVVPVVLVVRRRPRRSATAVAQSTAATISRRPTSIVKPASPRLRARSSYTPNFTSWSCQLIAENRTRPQNSKITSIHLPRDSNAQR